MSAIHFPLNIYYVYYSTISKTAGTMCWHKNFLFFLTNMFILNLINATNINKVQTTSPDNCNKEDDWPLICRTKAGEGFANISNLHKKRY